MKAEEIVTILKRYVFGPLDTYGKVISAEDIPNIAKNISKKINASPSLPGKAEEIPDIIYEVIETRISHFKEVFHKYEAIQLDGALQIIKNLVPPKEFIEVMHDYAWSNVRDEELFNLLRDFVFKTFPDATCNGHLRKLKIEADEVMQNNKDVHEFADCLLAIYGAAAKAGFSLREIVQAGFEKMEINKTRKWQKLPDGTYQHI